MTVTSDDNDNVKELKSSPISTKADSHVTEEQTDISQELLVPVLQACVMDRVQWHRWSRG